MVSGTPRCIGTHSRRVGDGIGARPVRRLLHVAQPAGLAVWRSNFDYPTPQLGGIECPDLFEMTADDGTRHWVLGASMDAYDVGLPMTYAYWMGVGRHPVRRRRPHAPMAGLGLGLVRRGHVAHEGDTRRPSAAIGWMNNWKYAARDVPTDATDGYNGQNSIVRELRLDRQPGGWYSLLSSPSRRSKITRLDAHASRPHRQRQRSPALERARIRTRARRRWDEATNVGVSVGRSADGSRHTNIGKYGADVYVDRGPSDRSGYILVPYTRAAAPIDPNARSMHLRIFVDRQSVEVFVNAGHTVLSQQVHFLDSDTGISLYTDGGPAQFTGITIREYVSSV